MKVSNVNTKKNVSICSKLTMRTPERRQWRRSGVCIVNFGTDFTRCCFFHCWLWTRKCRLRKSTFTKQHLHLQNQSNICDGGYLRSSHQRFYVKKVFLEILQNSQESTCAQVFSCQFCGISQKTFFTEHLWVTASAYSRWLLSQKAPPLIGSRCVSVFG